MKLRKIFLEPELELSFTPEEVKQLVECAKRHYDSTCRGLADRGGMIYGFTNRCAVAGARPIVVVLSMRDIDLLCKVTENDPRHRLHQALAKAFRRAAAARKTEAI